MSEVDSASAGEGQSAPVVSNTLGADAPAEFNSATSAAKALADLRWKRSQPQESSAESATAATAETQLSGEDNAGAERPPGETQEADPALPPIERPRSWSKDDDDDWAALPRARQEKIAANERAREADINRRISEAAEARKAVDAERAQAEQEKKTYQAKLPALMQALQDVSDREFPDIKSIADYERLAMEAHRITAEDPFKALQIGNYLKAFDAHQQKLVAVSAELQKAETEKQSATQAELNSYKNEQDRQFLEFAPELADPKKKAEVMDKAITALTNDLGFKADELNEFASNPATAKLLFHHAFQKLVYNHLKLSDLRAAPKAVVKPDLPPVVRPGTAKPSGAAQSERVQALDSKLTNSGSMKDAAALLIAKRNASRRAS